MDRLPTVQQCALVWGFLAVVAFTPHGNDLPAEGVATDVLLGGLTTVTIVAMARELKLSEMVRRPFLMRILELGPVVRLGAFSYSLYLVHFPVVTFCDRVLAPQAKGVNLLIAMLLMGVSSSLVIAFLFHFAFERPFMRLGVQVR